MTEPWSIQRGLAIYRIGDGKPALLMPGTHRFSRPGLAGTDALIKGLVEIGRQVITCDPPASGRSTRPAHLSMEEMHECAGEAVAACGVTGSIDTVGHSMSGLAALAYAIERPDRIDRLVLIGTGSGGPAYMQAPGALWNRSHPRFWGMAGLATLHIVWPRLGPERVSNNFIARESFCDRRLAIQAPVSAADWFRPREGRTD